MKTSQLFLGSIIAVSVGVVSASALATQPAACSVLTLAEVRAIVAAPVVVSDPSSFPPATKGSVTTSNCTYVLPKGKRAVKVSLMWAPSAHLTEALQFYDKRHKEAAAIKGDVLVLTAVIDNGSTGMTYDQAAGQALLTAALHKL